MNTCCGEHYPGKQGKPLILACQICPHSPTYWRRDATRAETRPAVSYEEADDA